MILSWQQNFDRSFKYCWKYKKLSARMFSNTFVQPYIIAWKVNSCCVIMLMLILWIKVCLWYRYLIFLQIILLCTFYRMIYFSSRKMFASDFMRKKIYSRVQKSIENWSVWSKMALGEVGVSLPWWCHPVVLQAPGYWRLFF